MTINILSYHIINCYFIETTSTGPNSFKFPINPPMSGGGPPRGGVQIGLDGKIMQIIQIIINFLTKIFGGFGGSPEIKFGDNKNTPTGVFDIIGYFKNLLTSGIPNVAMGNIQWMLQMFSQVFKEMLC